ncbi:hypothetical protein [Acrocarpospora sp. B8E8]|uniref:hypothetical protein n=1 Tax=Acrocarpospora sp. B8E8 TaxID=3153572 RepID=UPI00325F7011
MLDAIARIGIYQAQNGYGSRLTPKQQRRVNKKRHSQSVQASAVREARSKDRKAAAESRRRAELLHR